MAFSTRDETEQIAGDLAAWLPGGEGGVAELAEEHRVMQGARQVPVAPKPLEVPQDLGEVTVTAATDGDVSHSARPSRGAMTASASASLARAYRK